MGGKHGPDSEPMRTDATCSAGTLAATQRATAPQAPRCRASAAARPGARAHQIDQLKVGGKGAHQPRASWSSMRSSRPPGRLPRLGSYWLTQGLGARPDRSSSSYRRPPRAGAGTRREAAPAGDLGSEPAIGGGLNGRNTHGMEENTGEDGGQLEIWELWLPGRGRPDVIRRAGDPRDTGPACSSMPRPPG